MDLMVLVSGCVYCAVWGLLFYRRVFMRSAASFLYTSRSGGGSCDMAVFVSSVSFCIHSFFLV